MSQIFPLLPIFFLLCEGRESLNNLLELIEYVLSVYY